MCIDAADGQQAEMELVERLCFVFAATDDARALDSAIRIAGRWQMIGGESQVMLRELARQRRARRGFVDVER